MTAESFDAVLAEMRELCKTYDAIGGGHAARPIRDFANRLQAAHERSLIVLSDWVADLNSEKARADAAAALLREVSRNGWGKSELSDLHETPLLERIDAFLAHNERQGRAGEQEKGNG